MKSIFPVIHNISDIEYAIDRKYFTVIERDNHVIIDYIFSDKDTFKTNKHLELRGIIFDKETGNIIRRPFHKFFNINENDDTRIENIDISKSHIIQEKLDGSMIAYYETYSGESIYGTMRGETDIAKSVRLFVNMMKGGIEYDEFCNYIFTQGYTPIFEWISKENRIVVEYDYSSLVLLGIRHRITGEYLPQYELERLSKEYNIPLVNVLKSEKLSENFIETVKNETKGEGYVITFDETGYKIKIKNSLYLQLHRVKEYLDNERLLLSSIIDKTIDDIKPIMVAEDVKKIENFENTFNTSLNDHAIKLETMLDLMKANNITRKELAVDFDYINSFDKQIMFKFIDKDVYNEEDILYNIINVIKKYISKDSRYEEFKNSCFLKYISL